MGSWHLRLTSFNPAWRYPIKAALHAPQLSCTLHPFPRRPQLLARSTTSFHSTMATSATNTSLYKLNHTMLRVKDPKVSLPYYQENFGMKFIKKLDFEEFKFSVYFLAFDRPGSPNYGKHWTDREGILELTHNYGTENDPDFKVNNGNVEPWVLLRYGNICFTVDNLEKSISDLDAKGVKFHKRPEAGKKWNYAYVLDPDGYWIEVFEKPGGNSEIASLDSYAFHDTMLRVKDPKKSLEFYQSVAGMSLLKTVKLPEAKFNLYFLGYHHSQSEITEEEFMNREGILGLTYNYGTENDPEFKYHNGNTDPQGYGHICITVDDLDEACKRLEDLNVTWKKRLTDGKMKCLAFFLDPDGYWIEILQNEALKKRTGW